MARVPGSVYVLLLCSFVTETVLSDKADHKRNVLIILGELLAVNYLSSNRFSR